jgi:hypothetical protein
MKTIYLRNALLAVSAIFMALTFSQGDLAHTVYSSYAVLQGHIVDFYDFNQPLLVGNDYLILLYALFAIWMAPVYLLGLATPQEQFNLLALNSVELTWAKFGLVTLILFAAKTIDRISRFFIAEDLETKASSMFIWSPFALFAAVFMGQYDLIGLTLALLGYLYWLENRTSRFLVLFALALSFKYLALFIFLPLVLLRAKNLLQAAAWLAIAISPAAIQILAFQGNEAFRDNFLRQPSKLLIGDGDLTPIQIVLRVLALCAALAICIWLVNKKFDSNRQEFEFSLTAILASLTLLLVFIRWNPQWIIFVTPFWALVQARSNQKRLLGLIESIGFLGLIFMIANIWKNNLDDSMIARGPAASFFPNHNLRLDELFLGDFLVVGIAAVYVAIIAPLVARLLEIRHLDLKLGTQKVEKFIPKIVTSKAISIFVFAFFTVVCFLTPSSIAVALSDQTQINNLQRLDEPRFHSELLTLQPGELITQNLEAELPELAAVGFDVYTGGQTLNVKLRLSIHAGSQSLFSAETQRTKFKDASFIGYRGWREVTFIIDKPIELKSRTLTLSLQNTSEELLKLWVDTVRPNKHGLRLGGSALSLGTLNFSLYRPSIYKE